MIVPLLRLGQQRPGDHRSRSDRLGHSQSLGVACLPGLDQSPSLLGQGCLEVFRYPSGTDDTDCSDPNEARDDQPRQLKDAIRFQTEASDGRIESEQKEVFLCFAAYPLVQLVYY